MSDVLKSADERRRRAVIDKAIAASTSRAELVGHLERTEAADVAESLEGKALIASRSPWGTLAISLIGFLAARYGLHLDDTTVAVISGLSVLAGAFVMRTITRAPITGIVKPQPV